MCFVLGSKYRDQTYILKVRGVAASSHLSGRGAEAWLIFAENIVRCSSEFAKFSYLAPDWSWPGEGGQNNQIILCCLLQGVTDILVASMRNGGAGGIMHEEHHVLLNMSIRDI